jgi:hypothetical protein
LEIGQLEEERGDEMNLRKRGCEDARWIKLDQNYVQWVGE